MLSKEQRKLIRERVEKATGGPWVRGGFFSVEAGRPYPGGTARVGPLINCGTDHDLAFVASSRTDVPQLLDTCDYLEKEIEDLKEACIRKNEDGLAAYEWGYAEVARRKELEGEVKDLREALERKNREALEAHEEVLRHFGEVERLRGLVFGLRDALECYGWHVQSCPRFGLAGKPDEGPPCDSGCGFDVTYNEFIEKCSE